MGGNQSHEAILQNSQIPQLVGTSSFPLEDPFWQRLFCFQAALPDLNPFDVQMACREFSALLAENTTQTHNFEQLVRHIIASLKSTNLHLKTQPKDLINKLFLVRMFLAWFVEHLDQGRLRLVFGMPLVVDLNSPPPIEDSLPYQLLDTLFNFAIDVEINDNSYMALVEVLSIILVLFSTQMFRHLEDENNLFLDLAIGSLTRQQDTPTKKKPSLRTAELTWRLVHVFSLQMRVPQGPQRGLLVRAVSSVLMLPYQLFSYLFPLDQEEFPLSDTACHVMLALVFHRPSSVAPLANPALKAITQMVNVQTGSPSDPEAGTGQAPAVSSRKSKSTITPSSATPAPSPAITPAIDFAVLFNAIASRLPASFATLTLYLLVHRNHAFREYVITNDNAHALVIPLLECLYRQIPSGPELNDTYMQLVVLLILTQDVRFSVKARSIIIPNVSWIRERYVRNFSLQSLIVMVLVNTIIHMSKMKDAFLHSNCLAVLCNLSHEFRGLHPHASQRLVSLLDVMVRKFMSQRPSAPGETPAVPAAVSLSTVPQESIDGMSHMDEATLNLLVEMLAAPLCSQNVRHNAGLLYALVRQLHLLQTLAGVQDAKFSTVASEVCEVVAYFRQQLDSAPSHNNSDVLMQHLTKVLESYEYIPPANEPPVNDKIFTYEEEENPRGFFVPYLWSILYSCSRTAWDLANVRAFDAQDWLPRDFLEDIALDEMLWGPVPAGEGEGEGADNGNNNNNEQEYVDDAVADDVLRELAGEEPKQNDTEQDLV